LSGTAIRNFFKVAEPQKPLSNSDSRLNSSAFSYLLTTHAIALVLVNPIFFKILLTEPAIPVLPVLFTVSTLIDLLFVVEPKSPEGTNVTPFDGESLFFEST